MGRLDGRVAIVTGAGRGLGRAHALFLAAEGAKVVVNDVGASLQGEREAGSPAHAVVEEIHRAGGEAVASDHDVADWAAAAEMVRLAVQTFGGLHVLVNNAGIIRDRTIANLGEDDWDPVIRVQLRGHAAPTRHAMAYWRDRAKAGAPVKACVIHTTSVGGLAASFGQAGYAAAKLGIVGLSAVAALEGAKYGVRSNAVAPSGRTRMALEGMKGAAELMRPAEPGRFDRWDPANVSPLIGWLATTDCPATGQIFHVVGNLVRILSMPRVSYEARAEGRWTLDDLDRALPGHLMSHPTLESYLAP